MAIGNITLGSNRYKLAREVVRQPLIEFSDPYRTTSQQHRTDRTLLSAYEVKELTGGIGIARIDIAKEEHFKRFWDSTCETRWASQITPNILPATSTHADPCEHLICSAEAFGELWGIFDEDYSSSELTGIFSIAFGGSNWDGSTGTIEQMGGNAYGIRAQDVVVHKSALYCAMMMDDSINTRGEIYSSANGTTWTAATILGWDAGTSAGIAFGTRDDTIVDWVRLLDYGDRILCANYDPASGDIHVQQSVDSGANWTTICSIGSAGGPRGFVTFYDTAGAVAPVLGTREALYSIDIAGTSYDTLVDLRARSHSHNCRKMLVVDNRALYCPMGDGGIKKILWTGQEFVISEVGPTKDDGVPLASSGHVTYMGAADRWVFFAYGGHIAGTSARVFAIDKETDSLHTIFKHTSENVEIRYIGISSETDDIAKMHIALYGAAADTIVHIDYPLTNPSTNALITYNTSGIIQLPEFDGGMPDVPTNFLEAIVYASDLSASTAGEWIDLDYGLDGASYTTTDLGDFVSGDVDLSFGTGAGVSAKTLKVQLTLNRDAGTTTHAPKLKSFVVNYLKVPATRYEYYVEIDVEGSAKLRGQYQTPDTIRTELEAIQDSVTMTAMTYGTRTGVYVQTRPPIQYVEKLPTYLFNQWQEAWRSGNVVLYLVELL